jgi:phytoene/squalene synthetase
MGLGKDERALSVSSYHYQGLIKITEAAHNKVMVYKGTSRNHLEAQVAGFRMGDKDAAKRADDLLDVYCHGVALALGDQKQF